MERETIMLIGGPLDSVSVVVSDHVEVIDVESLLYAIHPLTSARIYSEPQKGPARRIVIATTPPIVYVRDADSTMKYRRP
jgi:hypothetical protein